ncbi:molybdopterin-dependent oxidoreductase [Pokkaliibacter sp. CJK22405]|uniref:molybdopterin-dependent oxidoreductase n=1 Tax=Pokkaliibacter sp. CJK22405 TaxID=3384615 RepID=UPI00398562DA
MLTRVLPSLLSAAVLFTCQPAGADESPSTQSVILTLHPLAKPEIALSLEDLERLPHKTIEAYFPNLGDSNKSSQWEGVPLSELTNNMGSGSGVTVEALNNYSQFIPLSDIINYDPVLAYKRDGQYMSVRHFGPLIVIYPLANNPSLVSRDTLSKMVWQVSEITMESAE